MIFFYIFVRVPPFSEVQKIKFSIGHFVPFFHLGYISLSPHSDYLSVSFSLLRKSAMSSAFESSGFMKKRSWGTLQGSIPCSPEPGTSVESSRCVACVLLLCLSHFFFQSKCLHLLSACCGLCLLCGVSEAQAGQP